MSDESFKVQWSVSLPPAAQYAKGHMLNLRGGSVEEVEEQFDAVLDGEFIQKATQVAALLVAAQTVQDGFTEKQDAAPGSPEQPASEAPSAGQGRFCPHGKRVKREGNGKRGPWVGYFCPLAKGTPGQCAPEFTDAA